MRARHHAVDGDGPGVTVPRRDQRMRDLIEPARRSCAALAMRPSRYRLVASDRNSRIRILSPNPETLKSITKAARTLRESLPLRPSHGLGRPHLRRHPATPRDAIKGGWRTRQDSNL